MRSRCAIDVRSSRDSWPAALLAWLAGVAADLARWTTAVGVVLALVPLAIWTLAALGSTAAVLSLVFVARTRSLALVK
jgi:hypothetical protein